MGPHVELSAWDTTFWGVRAARVTLATPSQLDLVDAECRELGVRWSSLLVPSGDLGLVNAAVRQGYEIVDVRCTLTARIEGRTVSTHPSLARDDEAPAVAAIARQALRHSRFFADRHLPDARCEDFYDTWVRNSFTGEMADAIVVSRNQGDIDGFITVRTDADGRASIPLVAVRPERHGRGVGRSLLTATLDWASMHGADRIDVVTQLMNGPAMRLYEAGGFTLAESGVWLHRWYE